MTSRPGRGGANPFASGAEEPEPAIRAPATGRTAAAVSSSLRDTLAMICLLSARSGLADQVAGLIDVEADHHRVILVDHVVAMHRIAAEEVAEAEEQRRLGVVGEPHDVLAGHVDPRRRVAATAPAAAAPAAVAIPT